MKKPSSAAAGIRRAKEGLSIVIREAVDASFPRIQGKPGSS